MENQKTTLILPAYFDKGLIKPAYFDPNPVIPAIFIKDDAGTQLKREEEKNEATVSKVEAADSVKKSAVVKSKKGRPRLNEQYAFLLDYATDDSGNADRFVAFYGDIVRFNVDQKKFFIWNEKFWEADLLGNIKKMAERVMKVYRAVADPLRHSVSEAGYDAFFHSRYCCNSSKINALIDLLKTRYGVRNELFDQKASLLCVKNGIVDLKSGKLLSHDKKLFLTQYVDLDYYEGLHRVDSAFAKFVSSICSGDVSLAKYLQTAFGYGITGETREQVFFILHGSGSNGKSTLIEAVSDVVAPLVKHLPVEVILGANDMRNGAKASPELAQCANARIVFASESNESDILNEGKIKNLTGQGTISVRHLYSEPFEFVPKFKIFMDTNHLPKVRGFEYAIWRRIKIIPFYVQFSGTNVDKFLPFKLRKPEEKVAILSWLVEGAVRYYKEGLSDADIIASAISEYKHSSDTTARFFSECVKSEEGAFCPASVLYKSYVEFCEENGLIPLSNTSFGKLLVIRGYEKQRRREGNVYLNLQLM